MSSSDLDERPRQRTDLLAVVLVAFFVALALTAAALLVLPLLY